MVGDGYDHGCFVNPTIIDGLPKDHPLLFEALFVPVLVIRDIHVRGVNYYCRLATTISAGEGPAKECWSRPDRTR